MGPGRRSVVCVAGATLLGLSIALAGCGQTSTTAISGGAARSISTPQPTATATVAPTATLDTGITPEGATVAGCQTSGSKPIQFTSVGPLKVSIPTRTLDHGNEQLPSNLPDKPYQIAASQVQGGYAPNPPVNPSLDTYLITVCNQASTPHTVSAASVSITSASPSSGTVSVWNICNGPYNTASKTSMGGCGGGLGGPGMDMLTATLASDSAGASASAQPRAGQGALPIALGPNQSVTLVIAVNGITSQGTYALGFGLSVDGAPQASIAAGDNPFLIAPGAVEWTGQNCQSAAMQSQIPPSSQNTYYVCPPAS